MAAQAKIDIVLSNGQQAGKTINELTAQTAKLAREVKKLTIGSEEWVLASEDFKKIDAELKNVKKEAFATAAAQDFLNSTFADMVPYQAEFVSLAKGVRGVGTALKATTTMAQLLKVALAATGIGLIVVALASLVTWLTKTQKGMDFVGKVSASVGAIFNVLIERLATVGEGMVKLFSLDFAGAWDSMKKAASGFGDELVKETKATWENTAAMQALTKQQSALEEKKITTRAQIDKLKMAAEDQSKSDSERLAAAQKGYDLENSLLNESINLQQQKIKLIEAENGMKGDTLTEDDIQVRRDAVIELGNLESESFQKQTELQNKINELKRSGEAADTKAHQDSMKASEERLKALEEEQKARAKFIEDSIAAETKAHEERKKLDTDLLAGAKEAEQKKLDDRLTQLTTMNEAEQRMIDELFLTNQLSQEERDQMMYDAQVKALQDRMTLLISAGETTTAEYQNLYMELLRLNYDYEQKQTEQTKKEEEKRKHLKEQGLAVAAGVFAGLAQLLSDNSKHRKKNLKAVKAAQVAEVAMNSATEVQAIWKNANAFPPPFNFIIGIAQTAIALGRAKGAINRINSVQIQEESETFAKGGPVFGPSHQAGGIGFGVKGSGVRHEMEGNEIILSKGVYQNPSLRAIASDLNVMGGGRSFALGGPVIRDRGMVNSASAQPGGMTGVTNSIAGAGRSGEMDLRLTNELLAQIAGYTRQDAEKPPLVMTDIEAGLYQLKEVRNDATF